jgi:hypothetical protein
MKSYKTEHYIFHYSADTKAEQDIEKISAHQETCFRYICSILGVTPSFKIEYYLCNSPEELGHLCGFNDSCNAFAAPPNKIYAVYNEQMECVGFHEDTHIISLVINYPSCIAIAEGLAVYFDRKWWGIQNMDWTGYYLKTDRYIDIDKMLNQERFYSEDCRITYPIMGAFTDWLISTYGIERYTQVYKQQNIVEALSLVYQKTPEELNKEFVEYVKLFVIDEILEHRMEELLNTF